jgi:predicted CxxxxCH...CXXCH cytochrome family protein
VTHVNGLGGKKLDCSECHVKPVNWDDPGHLTTPDGKAKTMGTVTFAATSLAALPGPGRTGPPTWDGATCSNVYCHGAVSQDPRATHTVPLWTGGHVEATCGSCHGTPPQSHDTQYAGNNKCINCHQLSISPAGQLLQGHVDGVVQVGDNSGTCAACHGSPGNPAPPRDLSGNTATTALGVGAHQAHLKGLHQISAPVACTVCHVVPADLHSPGHVDTLPPAEVVFSGLALNDGASPVWDRTTATCAGSYCHGGGTAMAADTAAALRKPVWTLGTSQAYCGSCHGNPPSTPAHAGVVYPDCARCHAQTVTPNGGIIVSGPPGAQTSAHINGVIDVTP